MGYATETMEQIVNLWKTIICEYMAVLVSQFQTSQIVLVLITFSQIPEFTLWPKQSTLSQDLGTVSSSFICIVTVVVTGSFPQQASHITTNIALYFYCVRKYPAEICNKIYTDASCNYNTHTHKKDNFLDACSQKITFKTFVCVRNSSNSETLAQQNL